MKLGCFSFRLARADPVVLAAMSNAASDATEHPSPQLDAAVLRRLRFHAVSAL